MIINENNKQIILQGKMKRGFNKDPKDIINDKFQTENKEIKPVKQNNAGNISNLKNTMIKLNRLK